MHESEGKAFDDLAGAASGGYGGYCPEGVPAEFALLSILAAFGVAFGVLYRALTLTTGGRRRKRSETGLFMFSSFIGDLAWSGIANEMKVVINVVVVILWPIWKAKINQIRVQFCILQNI